MLKRPVVYAFADVSARSPDSLSVIALDKKPETSHPYRSAGWNVSKYKLLLERRMIWWS
jgi:hypothetical protein